MNIINVLTEKTTEDLESLEICNQIPNVIKAIETFTKTPYNQLKIFHTQEAQSTLLSYEEILREKFISPEIFLLYLFIRDCISSRIGTRINSCVDFILNNEDLYQYVNHKEILLRVFNQDILFEPINRFVLDLEELLVNNEIKQPFVDRLNLKCIDEDAYTLLFLICLHYDLDCFSVKDFSLKSLLTNLQLSEYTNINLIPKDMLYETYSLNALNKVFMSETSNRIESSLNLTSKQITTLEDIPNELQLTFLSIRAEYNFNSKENYELYLNYLLNKMTKDLTNPISTVEALSTFISTSGLDSTSVLNYLSLTYFLGDNFKIEDYKVLTKITLLCSAQQVACDLWFYAYITRKSDIPIYRKIVYVLSNNSIDINRLFRQLVAETSRYLSLSDYNKFVEVYDVFALILCIYKTYKSKYLD